jgi:hypothetical protein
VHVLDEPVVAFFAFLSFAAAAAAAAVAMSDLACRSTDADRSLPRQPSGTRRRG